MRLLFIETISSPHYKKSFKAGFIKFFMDENDMYLSVLKQMLDIVGNDLVSVVLFGSRARKINNDLSDIDILVVLKVYEDYDFSDLRKYFLIKYGKKLDLQIFSKEDIISNFNDSSPLFVSLLLGKKILFDKEMFFKKAFASFIKKMVYQNITYCEGKNIWKMNRVAKSLESLQ